MVRDKVLAAYWGCSHPSNTNWLENDFLFPVYLLAKRSWEISGIPQYSRDGKLLEVGCSYGLLYLKQMRELGWEVLGIEPNRKAADFGSREFGLTIIND